MKRHFEHVQQRKQRVIKYGHAESVGSVSKARSAGSDTPTKQYAMFSGNRLPGPPMAGPASELRRRVATASNVSGRSDGSHPDQPSMRTGFGPPVVADGVMESPYQINAQEIRKNAAIRQQNAESIEAIVSKVNIYSFISISNRLYCILNILHKMGGLFAQMASLIVEQGETITRIEDDVELGHQQTTDAQESMQYFYEITKGNRGMIFKIFGLLIFFIFLFLVWLR